MAKNKKVHSKQRFITNILDYSISLYIGTTIAFLYNYWSETTINPWLVFGLSTLLYLILIFIPNTPGKSLYTEKESRIKFFSQVYHYIYSALIALTIVVGWIMVEISPVEFFTGMDGTRNIVRGLFTPDKTIFWRMVSELIKTIYLALMATIFAVPIAFLLSFLAASNLMNKTWLGRTVYAVIRTISTIIRSIEAIVWAIIFAVWVGIGPFAGMLALMIHSIAALVKLYSEQIENIDQGPVEAITSTGASTLQVWRYAVIPQIINPFLAFTIYRWDINVRMATIVGFVGGGGIGLQLFQKQQMTDWNGVGTIVWLIALAVWIMDMVSAEIRKKLLSN
ncbi:MAG: phosphonate ABC transporter, permease protein PhnE [Candidatus Cloacimonadales bacterium]